MTRRVLDHEVRRILAMVPWLVAHPGAAKADVAKRFGIDAGQLQADLDLMLMIGVPPYSPGDYVDVDDDGERVTVRMADAFARPVQLTAQEGLAVLAAGRALLAIPGSESDGALARALDKLAATLGDVTVDLAAPAAIERLRQAASDLEQLELDYWSAGRDDATTRVVDPVLVHGVGGAWYLDAFCHRAGARRSFRVDRIRSWRSTGQHFAAHEAPDEAVEPYQPRADDPRVRLRLHPEVTWVIDRYPVESVEPGPDSTVDVVLAVSHVTFLERLLLRLGPAASVVEVSAANDAVPETFSVSNAAARVLDRYRSQASR